MEIAKPLNTNDENSFDPTPRLKSSPILISFVSFNKDDLKCFHCGDEYTQTLFYKQKYCKKCLSRYIAETTDTNTYLDMCIYTMDLECNEHKMSRNKESLIENIQDWCENCSGISYFKQIYITSYYSYYNYSYYDKKKDIKSKMFESEKNCKLCGKLVYQNNNPRQSLKVCSNCYLISSGYIESTLTKQPVPILCLPWWDNRKYCVACESELKFISDCKKYCAWCCIIYIGCRYCITA